MVEVEQRALRPFEEHALAALHRLGHELRRVAEQRHDAPGQRLELVHHLLLARHGAAERGDLRRPRLERALHHRPRDGQVTQRAQRKPAPRRLVLVAGADAALRGADGVLAALAQLVDQAVVREDGEGAVGDDQALLRRLAAAGQLVELVHQARRVDDHPLRQDALRLQAQDAARDEADDDLLVTDDQGVPGVGTSPEANDHVRGLRVEVDDLPLTLVAPLRSHDRDGRHGRTHTSSRLAARRVSGPGIETMSVRLSAPAPPCLIPNRCCDASADKIGQFHTNIAS